MKPSEPEFINIGEIFGAWGTKGRLKVEPATEFPERFAPSSRVYVKRQPMTIGSCHWQQGKAIIKIDTIDNIEDAQKLQGQPIEIHYSQLKPLPEGQYYHFQLIGLEVWSTQGEQLGKVSEILAMKSNDVYVVHGAKGEVLIPAIEDVVESVNLDEGRIIIEPIEGLLT